MQTTSPAPQADVIPYLERFTFTEKGDPGPDSHHPGRTRVETAIIGGKEYPRFRNEFWTARQRQACSLHEIAYRACFKPQLPRFFINLFAAEGDVVYDPFAGRGTSIVEAALLGRKVIANDINPLCEILCRPRLNVPPLTAIAERLQTIPIEREAQAEIDLTMFYHPETLCEIVSLRNYLRQRAADGEEDPVDAWIRMVATNRLTGHSTGFFSVYTLPPNQAVSAKSQARINLKRKQAPPYRNVPSRILKKSRELVRRLTEAEAEALRRSGATALFLTAPAEQTPQIPDGCVQLTVTSPPFLDVVQYAQDNWLRWWFNSIDGAQVSKELTVVKTMQDWSHKIGQVFKELWRVTRPDGWVALEVGEVRGGKLNLDEHVVPLGEQAGFRCKALLINEQEFSKTANIWGIRNNEAGTNTNRVALFYKEP